MDSKNILSDSDVNVIRRRSCSVLTVTPCNLLAQALQHSLTNWGIDVRGNHKCIEDALVAIGACDAEITVALVDTVYFDQCNSDCFACLKRLIRCSRVLVLSKVPIDEMKHAFLRMGVHGYLMTSQDTQWLRKAIDELAMGGLWYERRVLRQAIAHQHLGPSDDRMHVTRGDGLGREDLTIRETAISELVRHGLRNKEIARRLNISEKTVKLHLNNIFRKLGITNRVQLCIAFSK